MMRHSLEKTGMVETDDGLVHYRYYEPHDEAGRKKTPMVVVHGGPGASHALLYDGMHALADERPVLFYDQLGSHFSPASLTDEQLTLTRFREELKQVLDGIGLNKVAVLGHSWGGAIAVDFAVTHPQYVDSLFLSSPLLSMPRWVEDCKRLVEQLPDEARAAIEAAERTGDTETEAFRAAEKLFMAQFGCRTEPVPSPLVAHGSKWNGDIYRRMWGASEFHVTGTLKDLDLFPKLGKISVPTTIVCGEHDMATPETMTDACRAIGCTRLQVLQGCAHLSFLEDEKAFITVVLAHLNDAEACHHAKDHTAKQPDCSLT